MKTFKMCLNSPSAVALWVSELLGQLSDGMWENSNPHDHWKFWHQGEVLYTPDAPVSTIELENYAYPKKVAYGFSRLIPIVGDRMLPNARMGKALGQRCNDRQAVEAGEYMPATMEIWEENKIHNSWKYPWAGEKMEYISHSDALRFYETVYTMKDMKRDLKLIGDLMKSLPR
ncbi:MAG: hypothetical protein WCV62_06725 [Candidatus Peribacteraceae bacterium]|jgi:hypothetical protein